MRTSLLQLKISGSIIILLSTCLGFGMRSILPANRRQQPATSPAAAVVRVQLVAKRSYCTLLQATNSTRAEQHKQDDEDDDDNNQDSNSSSTSPFAVTMADPTLLVGDMLGLAVAFQLLGLLDVVTDSAFARNGGWFQPLPAVPATLGTLVTRYSGNTLLYVVATIITNTTIGFKQQQKGAVASLMCFCLLRVVLAFILQGQAANPFLVGGGDNDDYGGLIQAIRECYFVVLAIGTTRYVIGKLFLYP